MLVINFSSRPTCLSLHLCIILILKAVLILKRVIQIDVASRYVDKFLSLLCLVSIVTVLIWSLLFWMPLSHLACKCFFWTAALISKSSFVSLACWSDGLVKGWADLVYFNSRIAVHHCCFVVGVAVLLLLVIFFSFLVITQILRIYIHFKIIHIFVVGYLVWNNILFGADPSS